MTRKLRSGLAVLRWGSMKMGYWFFQRPRILCEHIVTEESDLGYSKDALRQG
jgi:hypothetical protein